MTSFQMNGEWIDKNGRTWRSSQSGNTFNWVQDSGRVASGIVIPLNGGAQWAVLATFDGTRHVKFTSNGNQLISSMEAFNKAPSNSFPMDPNQSVIRNVPLLTNVMYQDYSGMIWKCTQHEGGHFVLSNLTDGRTCDGYIVFDAFRGIFIIYIVSIRNGAESIFKSETSSLNEMDLSNGDYFRRIGDNSPLPMQVGTPTTTQQLPQPTPTPSLPQPLPQPTTRYYRVGGGKDGVTTWTRWNGVATQQVLEGWEIVFEVDQNGNISGSNRSGNYTKQYSGTFKNNIFDMTVKFSDGRIAAYKGNVTGNKVRIDFVIQATGVQGGAVGDAGVNAGTLFETSAPPCQPKSYAISGKTYWKTYNGMFSSSILDGWVMNFSVDKYGNVSGSNKNSGQAYTKSYSGTLINNMMDVVAKWEDGRTATYKGSINNNTIKIDFIITKAGSQPGQDGDAGFNTGIVTTSN